MERTPEHARIILRSMCGGAGMASLLLYGTDRLLFEVPPDFMLFLAAWAALLVLVAPRALIPIYSRIGLFDTEADPA